MSGADNALVTSGQVDWLAAARMPVTFSLEVLSRFANADVDVITVGIGRLIAGTFSFPPEGQRELSTSLSHLKGVSSFSNALWFGFGIKHVVRTLADTEQGACLVSLCAATSTIYPEPFMAGTLWRELCTVSEMPNALTPSIHQWANLVNACSGALARSHFPLVYDHYYRLLVPIRPLSVSRRGDQLDATPRSVAEALVALAQLSKGTVVQTTFVGGWVCAWIAAVASCLLGLSVEIRDEHGKLLLLQNSNSDSGPPQACFARQVSFNADNNHNLIRSRRFVSSGTKLLRLNETAPPSTSRLGPSSWPTILSDAFPDWSTYCEAGLLDCAIVELLAMTEGLVRRRPLQPPARGRIAQTLDHLSRLSPEAAPWIQRGKTIYGEIASDIGSLPREEMEGNGWPDVGGRRRISFCKRCGLYTSQSPKLQMSPGSEPRSPCRLCDLWPLCPHTGRRCSIRQDSLQAGAVRDCPRAVARTLIQLMLYLSCFEILEDMPPRIDAVRQVYGSVSVGGSRDPIWDRPYHLLPKDIMRAILGLFQPRPEAFNHKNPVALAGSGICLYFAILENPDLPVQEAFTMKLAYGSISHRERHYDVVADGNRTECSSLLLNVSTIIPSPDLLVDETWNEKVLGSVYRARTGQNTHGMFLIGDITQHLEDMSHQSQFFHYCGIGEKKYRITLEGVSQGISPQASSSSITYVLCCNFEHSGRGTVWLGEVGLSLSYLLCSGFLPVHQGVYDLLYSVGTGYCLYCFLAAIKDRELEGRRGMERKAWMNAIAYRCERMGFKPIPFTIESEEAGATDEE